MSADRLASRYTIYMYRKTLKLRKSIKITSILKRDSIKLTDEFLKITFVRPGIVRYRTC